TVLVRPPVNDTASIPFGMGGKNGLKVPPGAEMNRRPVVGLRLIKWRSRPLLESTSTTTLIPALENASMMLMRLLKWAPGWDGATTYVLSSRPVKIARGVKL